MRSALPLLLFAAACGSGKQPAKAPVPADPKPVAEQPKPADAPPAPPAPQKPITTKSLAAIGLDPDAIDRNTDPCDDFYQFACGGWIAKAEIPADKPETMRSFIAIEDRNLEYEHTVLEQARTKPGDDPVLKQLGAFYGSCMDEAAIEKAGIAPIKPLLATVAKVNDAKSLSQAITALHVAGFDAVFGFGAVQDAADARNMIAGMDQGGLGLPNRDYYLKDDEKFTKLRAAYHDYVAAALVDTGVPPAQAIKRADAVLALETEIAKVSKDKVERRDPKTMYNKIDRAGVAKAMPSYDWDGFWKQLGLATVKDVTVTSPAFLAGVDALIKKTPADVWRDYLTAYVVKSNAGHLTKAIEGQRFKLQALLTGQEAQEARWKRCAEQADNALGDLLGQAFVRDRFGGASKTAADDQVRSIVAAMTQNLATLPWMDAKTKERAVTKLNAMTYQIGFPKKWKTYAFKLDPKAWGANALAANKAEYARDLAKIGKPVDKDDWGISAATVNAFYSANKNAMVFPAGILQPPFYSVDASIPVNAGGMGTVVGHELTHGFDDRGAQYDPDGNLRDWWEGETQQQFKSRTGCVKDQYSTYESGGLKVNGANTLSENIADIGGVKLALAGYRTLRASAPDTVVADGFTEDQQFFLAFGQAWCTKARPDFEQLLVNVDTHSPPKWRINGTLSATPDFAKAFRCKASAKMRPANACVVW